MREVKEWGKLKRGLIFRGFEGEYLSNAIVKKVNRSAEISF